MAYNVFGSPITNATLEDMPEYMGKNITRKDRAHVALQMKNAENKDANARTYVKNLKQEWGNGVSTLCLIYNATGDPVAYLCDRDWYGHIGPAPSPVTIDNGQWGAFLHVKTSGAASGSIAGVVYRGLNDAGTTCDWLLCWYNPWGRLTDTNRAYTEIREKDYFPEHWDYIYRLLCKAGLQSNNSWNGCVSTAVTGNSTSPIYEGIMTLEGA